MKTTERMKNKVRLITGICNVGLAFITIGAIVAIGGCYKGLTPTEKLHTYTPVLIIIALIAAWIALCLVNRYACLAAVKIKKNQILFVIDFENLAVAEFKAKEAYVDENRIIITGVIGNLSDSCFSEDIYYSESEAETELNNFKAKLYSGFEAYLDCKLSDEGKKILETAFKNNATEDKILYNAAGLYYTCEDINFDIIAIRMKIAIQQAKAEEYRKEFIKDHIA